MVKESRPRFLKTILDRLEKPINFACRDSFSYLSQVQGLQSFVEHQVSVALTKAQEPRLRKKLFYFQKLFKDFEAMSLMEAGSLSDIPSAQSFNVCQIRERIWREERPRVS